MTPKANMGGLGELKKWVHSFIRKLFFFLPWTIPATCSSFSSCCSKPLHGCGNSKSSIVMSCTTVYKLASDVT